MKPSDKSRNMPPKDPTILLRIRDMVLSLISDPNQSPILFNVVNGLMNGLIESKGILGLTESEKLDFIVSKINNKKFSKAELKSSGVETLDDLKTEIDKFKVKYNDSKNPDKIALRKTASDLETKEEELKKVRLEQDDSLKMVRESSLREGETKGRSELFGRLDNIDRGVSDIKSSINNQLRTYLDGEYKDHRIQQLEFKERPGVTGLGLTIKQRAETKKII